MGERRVVMLAGPGAVTPMLYHELAGRFGPVQVIMEAPMSRVDFMRRRARKLGWVKVGHQTLFQAVVAPALRLEGRRRIHEIQRAYDLRREPIPPGQISAVPSVNSEEARQALQRFNPEVVVISATRIVSKATLACVDAPFINLHTGITPFYRGVHGGYWALRQREPERFGVTVHLVDPGIDTGEILAQRVIQPSKDDNFATYPYLQFAHGVPMVGQAVEALLGGETPGWEVRARGSRLWSHPTVVSYLRGRSYGVR
ncbi:formyl transferase [Lujinxingia litoralis]|uniref:phosphoribosylglycinamide formyltransferase 1 n=1 Tax=Lujinxingia litoralis TaxID=2211119 RepID=A0A328C3M1_9DELT|nr:formyl transferase [Lujinxingia litoralis]RAL20515.1 formyl transferase [Lujinxingia litoralis]